MSWAVLIQTLLAFFGPFLKDLLNNLLKKPATMPAGAIPVTAESSVQKVFDALRAQTYVWQFGARSRIALGRRIALKHANQLVHSARTGAPLPPMDADDLDALADV